jgi:hypothetical protein
VYSAPHIDPSHRGLEHRRLGVPEGKKISVADLMGAKRRDKKSGNVKGEREDQFAINARKWKH